MSGLTLDARQRAMLDEMGVKVWWPAEPAVVAAPAGGAKAGATSAAGAMHVAEARMAEASSAEAAEAAEGSAAEAPARHAGARPAAASPGSAPPAVPAAAPRPAPTALAGDAVQLEAPQRLYGGSAAQGGWLVVADMPPEPGGAHGEPFAGEAGRLLENMLRALRLDTGALPVHLMRVHRGGTGAAHRPHGADGAGTLAQAFAAHAAALAPRMVLAMGPLAAQGLLQRGEPLGKLRGRVGECALLAGLPLVATYHPAYLLRNPADKARAWADLCLAAAQIG